MLGRTAAGAHPDVPLAAQPSSCWGGRAATKTSPMADDGTADGGYSARGVHYNTARMSQNTKSTRNKGKNKCTAAHQAPCNNYPSITTKQNKVQQINKRNSRALSYSCASLHMAMWAAKHSLLQNLWSCGPTRDSPPPTRAGPPLQHRRLKQATACRGRWPEGALAAMISNAGLAAA